MVSDPWGDDAEFPYFDDGNGWDKQIMAGYWTLEFDGENDRIDLPSSLANLSNSTFTLVFIGRRRVASLWAPFLVTGDSFGGQNQFLIAGWRATNDLAFAFNSNDLDYADGTRVPDDNDIVVMRREPDNRQIVLNGSIVASQGPSSALNYSIINERTIGDIPSYTGGALYAANMVLVELHIWGKYLSDGEIAALEIGALVGNETDLLHAWRAGESTTTLTDLTGTAHGTIVGATPVFVETTATEIVDIAPDQVVATTNLKDSNSAVPPVRLADLQDDPADPDALWWTAIDPTLQTVARLRLPMPADELMGVQTFGLWLRKTPGEPNPTVDISVLQGEVEVGATDVGIEITSDSGQLVEITRAGSDFPSEDDVEILITGTPGSVG